MPENLPWPVCLRTVAYTEEPIDPPIGLKSLGRPRRHQSSVHFSKPPAPNMPVPQIALLNRLQRSAGQRPAYADGSTSGGHVPPKVHSVGAAGENHRA